LAAVQLEPALNAFFMALAAGAMIFVSLHELVPMAARFRHLPLFAAGLGLSVPVYVVLRWLVPDS
jgi:ZIP family zinc transporter